MATTTAAPRKRTAGSQSRKRTAGSQSRKRTAGAQSRDGRTELKGSSRAGKPKPGGGSVRARTERQGGRSTRARPAAQKPAGRARPARAATRALQAAAKADPEGPGTFKTLGLLWRVARIGFRLVRGKRPKPKLLRKAGSSAREVGLSAIAARARKLPLKRLAQVVQRIPAETEQVREHIRRVPVQSSLDVGVPIQVAFEEWMRLDSLPEGAHRVEGIKRRGERLTGHLHGFGAGRAWEAEIRDERPNESFAWLSTGGSDVAGLITFHRLSERLTRLELDLDVIPTRAAEAVALALHFADRRADAELRRFKLRVETISPDAYPPHVKAALRKKPSAQRKPSKANKKEE